MCIHKYERKESMNIYVSHVHTHEKMENKQWTPSSLSDYIYTVNITQL